MSCHCKSSASTSPEMEKPFVEGGGVAGDAEAAEEAGDEVPQDDDEDEELLVVVEEDGDSKAGVVAKAGGVMEEDVDVADDPYLDGDEEADEAFEAFELIDDEVVDEDIVVVGVAPAIDNDGPEDSSCLVAIIKEEVFSNGSI